MSAVLTLPTLELPGRATAFGGEILQFEVGTAFPPGAPVSGEIRFDSHPDLVVGVTGKTIRSQRRGEGFEVRARLTNLRRADRLTLERLLPKLT